MKFTDIFIKKPVLSVVISLVILFLGLRSITELGVRQFPKTEDTLITVQTAYPGASAQVVQGFITTPLERAISSAEGIDYMTSASIEGVSTINVYMKLNYDPNAALAEVLAQTNSVLNQLPRQAQLPVITKTSVSNVAYLYLAFTSESMNDSQMTDYINRVILPQLQAVNGVGQINVYGNKTFAMRIWLNPQKMAQFGITPQQAYNAIYQNNYISAAGSTKNPCIQMNISIGTDLHSVEQFRNLVVANYNGTLIRLKDIAKIELGSINYDAQNIFNGKKAIVLGIFTTPSANPLTVVKNIRAILPSIKQQLPSNMHLKVAYDRTQYISGSIDEVVKTVFETLIIVVAVIFLFLGSYRSVTIPVVAIPLSIVGGFFIMFLLGYTINLLTLLAMVLAIGLVVDDAIIVVENVDRHINDGKTPFEASLLATRELGVAIIAMSITLVAVFLPIGFMSGLNGALFKEFAFTLAGDVIISGIVALTLSPMLSSKFLKPVDSKGFVYYLDKFFEKVKAVYAKILNVVLESKAIVVFVIIVVLTSAYFLFITSKFELAPTEDQGVLFVQASAAPMATLNELTIYSHQIEQIYKTFPVMQQYFMALGAGSNNALISGFMLKPWSERNISQMQVMPILQQKLDTVAGLQTVVFPLPSLPGSQGLPVQFVITTPASYTQLYQIANELIFEARKSGFFGYMDSDLKYDQPQINITINKSEAQSMGINMQTLGDTMSTLLSENYVNWFSMQGYSYKVIPQITQKYRYGINNLYSYYISASNGQLVPLSSVIKIDTSTVPQSLNRFNQQNSATISATLRPGITMGQALSYLESLSKKIFPKGFTYNFAGQSRQFVQEGSSMLITFVFALVIIYLVLAALFESFVDPLIVLISVPMSITGALIFLSLGFATVNIYTEVGLVTLIGLITKHGILIVKFANDLQDEGIDKLTAIKQAASIRLRPILMTTLAMVLGVVPLLLATGAGAVSRFDIGLVIASGLSIGTFLTIFVVPTVYLLIGEDKNKEKFIS